MFVFFQDDWYHLYQIFNKNFWQIALYFNLWQNGNFDLNNFYRPLSTKLFYFLIYQLAGLKPFFFYLSAWVLFALNALVFYILSKEILKEKKQALLVFFFYFFSLGHFTYFSYITALDNLLYSVFLFLSIYSWIKNKKILSYFAFILSLMSRESAVILPFFIFAYLLIIKRKPWKQYLNSLIVFSIIDFVYFLSRFFIYQWPQRNQVYYFQFGNHVFKNLLKYLQWNFNLSGLISIFSLLGSINLLIFILFLLSFIPALLKNLKLFFSNSFVKFGLIWWLIFLMPVLFFKNHCDPWNLIVSSGGMALILQQISYFLPKTKKIIFIGSFFLLFVLGFSFYLKNHWTIKRANLVKQTYNFVKNQCSNNQLIITAANEEELKELQYSWYYDLGPKVLCQKENLEIIYQLKSE